MLSQKTVVSHVPKDQIQHDNKMAEYFCELITLLLPGRKLVSPKSLFFSKMEKGSFENVLFIYL